MMGENLFVYVEWFLVKHAASKKTKKPSKNNNNNNKKEEKEKTKEWDLDGLISPFQVQVLSVY